MLLILPRYQLPSAFSSALFLFLLVMRHLMCRSLMAPTWMMRAVCNGSNRLYTSTRGCSRMFCILWHLLRLDLSLLSLQLHPSNAAVLPGIESALQFPESLTQAYESPSFLISPVSAVRSTWQAAPFRSGSLDVYKLDGQAVLLVLDSRSRRPRPKVEVHGSSQCPS